MAYLDQGKKFLAAHDTNGASVQLRNAVKIKKDLVEAWESLAEIEETKQQWPSYVGIIRTILEISPGNVKDRLKLARILFLGGATNEALKLVNEALELKNQDPAALALKATTLAKLDDHKGYLDLPLVAMPVTRPGCPGDLLYMVINRYPCGRSPNWPR
jgi:tetratricopeptide (TPR) repeat protein